MLCSYKGGGRGAIALYFYVQLTKVNSISDKVTGGRGGGGGAGSRHFWERPRTHDWISGGNLRTLHIFLTFS